MRIGFDAKRAFFNRSGLGNYSRDTIRLIRNHSPGTTCILFTPGENDTLFRPVNKGKTEIVKPEGLSVLFPSLWRSLMLAPTIRKHRVDIFHGLSNELPADIRQSKTRSVVTIHDLIFLRFPSFYHRIDRAIYRSKFSRSTRDADTVIAISRQTRDDLVEFLGVSESRISVVYQGCSPAFYHHYDEEMHHLMARRYGLPPKFILSVGTIEERKNQLSLVRAMHENRVDYPLVFVGRPTAYARKIREYIHRNRMEQVFFLENLPFEDLPVIYRMARLFVYPSLFEGFGIPILEALNSGVPVITSSGGCFREAGGKHSRYVDPLDTEEMGQAILGLMDDDVARERMIEEGKKHALEFRDEVISRNLMQVYHNLM